MEPDVIALSTILAALPVCVTSVIKNPLPVWAPVKLIQTPALPNAAVEAEEA
jgi:hypothetical protein